MTAADEAAAIAAQAVHSTEWPATTEAKIAKLAAVIAPALARRDAERFAKVHTGMRVNGKRILSENNQGYTGMRKEMAVHLEKVAFEYYSGNTSIVDEFLQLYCFGESQRKSLAPAAASEGARK